MTIENGAEQAANDILLQDDEIEAGTPDDVEVEYEGKTYCLPPELKDENPRGIWRMIEGKMTQEAISSPSLVKTV